MKIHIKTRRAKRHGLAFDLDYRWNGKRYRPLLGYDLSSAEAQQRAIAMIQTIHANAYPQAHAAQHPLTMKDLLPLFWNSFTIKNRVDRERPAGIIENYLLPFFGGRSLHSVTQAIGEQYILDRKQDIVDADSKKLIKKGATAGTIRREWQVLMRILTLGVRHEKLDRNRLTYVDLPAANKRTRVAEAEELEALRTIKEKDLSRRECRHELWRIIQVALNVGLREGKILTIERSWIKKREDGYWLCLPPAVSQSKGNPKEIPLNRIALSALAEDLPSPADGRVFRHWTSAVAFKKYWLETVRRVRLQNLRFHDLRHTFTTRLQRLGVDYELRQALLGHRMPGMTANYSHGGPEWDARLRDAVTRLEQGYSLVYGLVYERSATKVVGAKYVKTGETAGTQPQVSRYSRAADNSRRVDEPVQFFVIGGCCTTSNFSPVATP